MDCIFLKIINSDIPKVAYAYVNDNGVLNEGLVQLNADEVNLFDDFYFGPDGVYRKVDDGNGGFKKLAVMFSFVNIDDYSYIGGV